MVLGRPPQARRSPPPLAKLFLAGASDARIKIRWETADKPGSVRPGRASPPGPAVIPLGLQLPTGSSHLPAGIDRADLSACLFGVAPDGGCRVSPPGLATRDSS